MKPRWLGGPKVHFDHKFIHACELKYRFSLIEAIGVLAPIAAVFGALYVIGHALWLLLVHTLAIYVRPTPENIHLYVAFGVALSGVICVPVVVLALPWCMRVRLWLLRRKGAPICVYCSYDMSSIDTLTCPECGHTHRSAPGKHIAKLPDSPQ